MANNQSISISDLKKEQQKTETLLNSINPEYFNTKEGQDFLDLKDSGNYTDQLLSETVDDIQNSIELVENTTKAVEILSEKDANNMASFATSTVKNVLNIPNGEQQVANDMAKAFVSAYNAQHPIKYAMQELGASLKSIAEIPSKMKDNVLVAKNSGLDYQNAMQKAAKAISVKAGGIYDGAKDVVTTNALAVATNANKIYNDSVENLHITWNKAKEGMVKALYTVGKAIDIGLETMTLGGWSKFCDDMYKAANGQTKTTSERLTELGYAKETVNLFKTFDDDKTLLDNNNQDNRFSKAIYNLHCKLTGDSLNESIHQEYWGSVKQEVWGKDENAYEGNFGCTSPIDKVEHAIEQADLALAKADRSVSDFTNNAKDIVVQFVKDIPENTKKFGDNAANFIKDCAKEAGALAVTTFANLRAGSLRQFAKLVDKVELAEKSAMRRNKSTQEMMGKAYQNAHSKINRLEAEIEGILGQRVEANFALPGDVAELKSKLEVTFAAKPTAEVSKALDIIEKMEKSGTIKEEFKATVTNMVHMLKNSGVIISDKINIMDLKEKEENALKQFFKAQEKVSTHELRAENAKDFAQNLRSKATEIEFEAYKATHTHSDVDDSEETEDEVLE